MHHRKRILALLEANPDRYVNDAGKKDFSLLMADYLASIGHTPWMSLEVYNLFVRLAKSHIGNIIPYDVIMRRVRERDFSKTHAAIKQGRARPEKILHLVNHQSSDMAQGIVELVSNGMDALS